MNPRITPEALQHIAHLARLNLTPAEEQLFARHASQILDYIDMLHDLDTSAITPTFQVQPQVNILRDDELKPSLGAELVLRNAPARDGDYFKMPRIL